MGHTVSVCDFVKTTKLLSRTVVPQSTLTGCSESANCPTPSPAPGGVSHFNFSQAGECVPAFIKCYYKPGTETCKTHFIPSRADILVGRKTHKYFLTGCVSALKETGQVH